jgi:hypothetical protein
MKAFIKDRTMIIPASKNILNVVSDCIKFENRTDVIEYYTWDALNRQHIVKLNLDASKINDLLHVVNYYIDLNNRIYN